MMKNYFSYLFFLIIFSLLFFLYFPAREGRFVHDFIYLTYYYYQFNWLDVFNCKWASSSQVCYLLIFYSIYVILKTNAVGWLVLFSFLQSGVITFSFILFKKLLNQAKNSNAFGIALTGSLLILFSPYMCEPVAWGATIQYLLASGALTLSWLVIIRYIETKSIKLLLTAHVIFFISMYSLEFAVVFPFIIAIYIWLWPKEQNINLRQALFILLPQLFIVFSFFAMNRIFKSNWVGHYGADVHLNLPPLYLASQLGRYLFKYIAFVHYYPYSIRNPIYTALGFDLEAYLFLIALYIFPLLIFIIRFKKISAGLKAGFVLYFMMCLALLPTQNLYFQYLFHANDDRFGYFFSLFFYVVIAYVLVKLFKKWGYLIALCYGLISFYFLTGEISDWKQAGDVVQTLIKDYKWENTHGRVHILCLGNNINGAYVFKNYSSSATFDMYYKVMTDKRCSRLKQYMYMTMTNENDSVNANIVNDSTIRVNLLTANKLTKEEVPAHDYNIDSLGVYVRVDAQQSSYQITFRNKKPGDVYIYESALHWKQVNGF